MQFDGHPNPVASARRAFPFVAVMQSDLAETGRDRVVAFLAPQADLPRANGRLMPIVEVRSGRYALLLPSLTSVRASDLHAPMGNVGASRDRIIEALDWLFLGV